ncbi:MAG: YihY/virulence factor BrkB family protein, partial [Proteobacteria bacterium]|nr:YihY/virulence factor BrkB family protein [Pseudomonadota bacterium]
MAFGIAKGFGFKEFLEKRIFEMFAGQEQVIQNVLAFSTNLLEKTKGGLMAILGVILLFYSLIKLIGHIENAFNKIWWVHDDRPLIRKFTDYIAISITAGMLILFSSSANIFITAYLAKFLSDIKLPGNVENLISLGFNIFPFLPIWILFIFFYIFIPNKKVNIKAVFAGGMIAGTIFQVAQMAYLKFQVGVSSYNAIYGSFAALPLFLIWLQASWAIFLFGAEVAFSWENIEALETQNIDYGKISIRLKKLIVLRIVHLCVIRFATKKTPASDIDIASEIKIPLKIVKVLLSKLIECRILLEVNQDNGIGYVPAQDIECLTLFDVLTAFEQRGDDIINVGGTMEFEALEESLNEFAKACKLSPGERNFKDI